MRRERSNTENNIPQIPVRLPQTAEIFLLSDESLRIKLLSWWGLRENFYVAMREIQILLKRLEIDDKNAWKRLNRFLPTVFFMKTSLFLRRFASSDGR